MRHRILYVVRLSEAQVAALRDICCDRALCSDKMSTRRLFESIDQKLRRALDRERPAEFKYKERV